MAAGNVRTLRLLVGRGMAEGDDSPFD